MRRDAPPSSSVCWTGTGSAGAGQQASLILVILQVQTEELVGSPSVEKFGGRRLGWIMSFQDTGGLRQARQRLYEADRGKPGRRDACKPLGVAGGDRDGHRLPPPGGLGQQRPCFPAFEGSRCFCRALGQARATLSEAARLQRPALTSRAPLRRACWLPATAASGRKAHHLRLTLRLTAMDR